MASSQRDIEGAREKEPLLLASARSDTEEANEQKLLQLSDFVNANSGWYLFLSNVQLCLMAILAVSASWIFVLDSYDKFMPLCYKQKGAFHVQFCNWCTLSFWTYPLLCPVVAVFVVWRRLLETRMYYECLIHSITPHIEENALSSPVVWILAIGGVSTLFMLLYVGEDVSAAMKAAYFMPLLTFLIFVYSKWNINSYLIALPNFCARDPGLAGRFLDHGKQVYCPERQLRCAFENVNDFLGSSSQTGLLLNSSAFFSRLHDACKTEMSSLTPQKPSPEGTMQKVAGFFGLVSRPEFCVRFPEVSRPEVLGTWFSISHGFWAKRILFHKNLSDARSESFRKWYYAFMVFGTLDVLLCTVGFCWCLGTWMAYEHLVDPRSTIVWLLRFGQSSSLMQENTLDKLE